MSSVTDVVAGRERFERSLAGLPGRPGR
jgi:hypothetical protein